MPANGRSCATCEFWEPPAQKAKYPKGECRTKNGPFLQHTPYAYWCGAWKRDEGPKEEQDG